MSTFWFPLFKLCWSTSTKWETESTKWVTKQQSGSTNQQSGSTNQQVGRPRINQGGRANYMAYIGRFGYFEVLCVSGANGHGTKWDKKRPNLAKNWHFWPNMGIFGPFNPMPDLKTIRTSCLGGLSVMWIPKLLLTHIKIRIFGP